MRSIVSALLLMTTLSGLSTAGEMPFDPVHYEAMRNSGQPFAVMFRADWDSRVDELGKHPHLDSAPDYRRRREQMLCARLIRSVPLIPLADAESLSGRLPNTRPVNGRIAFRRTAHLPRRPAYPTA